MKVEKSGSPEFDRGEKRPLRMAYVLFPVLSVLIIIMALIYYYNQKEKARTDAYMDLSAVSHLKCNQISGWIKGCLADASVIQYNRLVTDEFNALLKSRDKNSRESSNILVWLNKRVSAFDYLSGALIDTEQNPVIWTNEFEGHFDSASRNMIKEGALSNNMYLSDIFLCGGKPRILLIIPLWRDPAGSLGCMGHVVFSIDPARYLYPFIKEWPYSSETAENFVVRMDSDSILFLSSLKFRNDAPLQFKEPASLDNRVAVIALTRGDTIINALDYRNEKVFAFALKIPGSQWSLISKIDEEEVYLPAKRQSLFIFLFAFTFIGLTAFVFLLIQKSVQAKLYRNRYWSQLEKDALLKHFELLTKYANDNIFLIDENERIIFANEKASLTYQYGPEEILGMFAKELRSPEAQLSFEELRHRIRISDGIIYETEHMTKDGSLFPVEASTRAILMDGKKFYQSIVRDISERRKSEHELKISGELLNERARDVERLYRAGVALNSTLDLAMIYENVYRVVKNTMECDDFAISSFSKDDNLIRYEFVKNNGVNLDPAILPPIKLNLDGGGIQSRVLNSRKSALFADYRSELNKCNKIIYVEQGGLKYNAGEDSQLPASAMMAPIMLNEDIIGLLQVFSYKTGAYSETNLNFLEALSPQIAAATANATLYKQAKKEIEERKKAEDALRKSELEIKERAREMGHLFRSGAILNGSLELPVIYESIFNIIKDTMECDDFIISSYDEIEKLIKCEYLHSNRSSLEPGDLPPIPLNPEGGIQSEVIISGKPKLIMDYALEAAKCKKVICISREGEVDVEGSMPEDSLIPQSAILAPIIVRNRVTGTIQVLSYKKYAFNANHLRFLMAISGQIAIATTNASLYKKAKKEIEERKRAEEALKLTHFSVDKASDAIVWINEAGKFTEVNDAACSLFGLTKEVFTGLRIQDFDFIKADEEWVWFWNHVKENRSILREDQISVKGGKSVDVEILANYIEFEGKSFLVVFGRDITKRKKADEQIRFQSSLLDVVEHTVIASDKEGKIIYWNKFAESMHGWKAEEVIGRRIKDLLLDPSCVKESKEIEYTSLKGISWHGEIISKRKDGSRMLVSLTNTPILDSNGDLIGTVGAAIDITESKLAEKALMESEKRHRELFEYANDAILVIDPESEEIFDANNKACELYGVTRSELVGDSMRSFTADVAKGELNNERLMMLGSVRNVESVHLKKNGIKIDVMYNASVIEYNGKPAILSINHDITERKKQERIIEQSTEQLRLLYETSERLNKSLNLDETYDTIHSFISGIMDCDSMYLSSFDPDEKLISCLAGWNGEKKIDISRFPKLPLEPGGHGTQSSVVLTGKSLLVNDLRKHVEKMKTKYFVDDEGNVVDEVSEDSEFKNCALLVPLKIDNSVIGVMQVFSHRKNAYTENNKQLLESIALHISSSVNNSRLYEKAQIEIAERKKAEKELIANREGYRNLFESANDAILVLDPETENVLDANQRACELYGFAKNEFIGKSMLDLSVNPELSSQKVNALFTERNIKDVKTKQINSGGSVIDVIYNASLIDYNGKKAILTVNRDDTMRKKSEEEMLKLSTAVQQSPESIIITNLDGKIEYVNRGFIELTGYRSDEAIGSNPRMLQSGFTPIEIYKDMWNTILSGRVWYGELLNKKKNGDLYWQSVSITPIKNVENKTTHFLSIQENITEKKAKDERLRNSLKEKETMLKEIHHRVKNNLQIVSSLLKLQSQFLKDKDDILIFEDSQRRIRAMSLIHQNLYNSENLSSIDFGDYVRKLVRDLFSSFNISSSKVTYDIKIDGIFLDIETSIPCGLLINELVSNSLKYAFDGGGESVVRIELTSTSDSGYKLIVGDNGKGLPPQVDFRNTKTLGLQLVCSLTQQLEGVISLNNSHGAEFSILFISSRYTKRI